MGVGPSTVPYHSSPRLFEKYDITDPAVLRRKRFMMFMKLFEMSMCAAFLGLHNQFKADCEDDFTTFEICMGVATAGALLLVTTFLFLDYWDTFRPNHQELRYDACGAVLLLCITLYMVRRGLHSCSDDWRVSTDFLSAAEEKQLMSEDYVNEADDSTAEDETGIPSLPSDKNRATWQHQQHLPEINASPGNCSAPAAAANILMDFFICTPGKEKSIPLFQPPLVLSRQDDDGEKCDSLRDTYANATMQLMLDEQGDQQQQQQDDQASRAYPCHIDGWLLGLIATAALGFLAYTVDYLIVKTYVKKLTWTEWFADLAEFTFVPPSYGVDPDEYRASQPVHCHSAFRPTPTSAMSGSWTSM